MRLVNPVVCAAFLTLVCADVGFADEQPEPEKQSVWSTVELQVYGYVKLDASYDTGPADPGNFVRWIDLRPQNQDDDEFNMTANQTRFGLWIRGPEEREKRIQTAGRVEIDFYGGGPENRPWPMLRLAYIDLVWPHAGWRMLAGQSFDVISPLNPNTVNYSVQWWAGNIGYRRPQIQLSRYFSLTDSTALKLVGAITRNIGTTDSVFAEVDAGSDAGIPGLQGRVAVQAGGSRRAGPFEIGLSGHWAEEEYDLDDAGNFERFDSWSANLDLEVPLSTKITLQAEAYTGANLSSYLGGIGQGVNLDLGREIGDTGGWLSVALGPYGSITHHAGVTHTDPDDDDLEIGDHAANGSIFWNGIYDVTGHVQFALELSYWRTEYKQAADQIDVADSLRTQFAVIYRF